MQYMESTSTQQYCAEVGSSPHTQLYSPLSPASVLYYLMQEHGPITSCHHMLWQGWDSFTTSYAMDTWLGVLRILGGEDLGQCPTSAVMGDSRWLVPSYKTVHCDLLLHIRYSVWSSVVILSYITCAAGKASGEGGGEHKFTFQLLC